MNNEYGFPKRMPTRLKDFDYSLNGTYFVTICTQNRKNILSEIVGEGFPLPNYEPVVRLSCFGKIVDKWIGQIQNKYPSVSVDCYVIMPNHLHLMLTVAKDDGRGDPSPTVDAVVGWLKFQSTKEINKIQNSLGEKVFQRSFYDHIVRNQEDYEEIGKYIFENPARWQFDKLFNDEH